jgi:biotin carboxyl carrier protein
MDLQRAVDLASRLALAYPGRQVDEGHVVSWAELLTRYDESVVAVTIERLRENFPSPPSAASVLEELRDVQATYHTRPTLPDVGEAAWAPKGVEMPEEVRSVIEQMQAAWADEAKRTPEEEEAEWEQKKLRAMTGPKLRSPCAAVVGEPVVRKGSHTYCPSCGEDLDSDCPPQVRTG